MIGAALLVPAQDSDERRSRKSLTQLEPVFVVPGWQRRGVATALVSHVLRRLADAGQEVLESGCSDYNMASRRWHLRLGAVEAEESCYYRKIPIFRWIRTEILRQRKISTVFGIPFDRMQMERMTAWRRALAEELNKSE